MYCLRQYGGDEASCLVIYSYCVLCFIARAVVLCFTMHRSTLLPFQQEMAQELNASDALCIAASGIGWIRPISAFLRSHAVKPNRKAVVLLGCSESQKKELEEELARENPSEAMPVDFGGGKVPQSKRQAFYDGGRCCRTTSHLLINDLLKPNLRFRSAAFSGLFVFNAEDV